MINPKHDKQDRQGARTPADLERRHAFEKQFNEIRSIAEKAQKSYDSLDQEAVFNRLTNNGEWQGVYTEGGNIYINASYIKSGEFLADLIKAGVLQSVDGETFKLDLDQGIMTLKSGGETIMHVDGEGATFAGWNVNKNYLGTSEFGLNGDISVSADSVKGGTSPIRFYAGASDATAKNSAIIRAKTDSNGNLSGSITLNTLLDETDVEVISITDMSGRSFTEANFDPLFPFYIDQSAPNVIAVGGRFNVSTAYNSSLNINIQYGYCTPAFQVLDDGTLVARYAKLGGYDIADIIARIEALEGK